MRLRRTTARLARKPFALGLVVCAIGAAMAVVAWESTEGVPFQDQYEITAVLPKDAPILQKGDQVRVSGRLAGFVTDSEPRRGGTALKLALRPGFAPVGRDARTNVKVASFVYVTYLEIFPGNRDDPMPEGGEIPMDRSTSGVDLLETVQLFDKQVRRTLSRATFNAGIGLAGRGRETNAALADLPVALRDGAPLLDGLTPTPGVLAESVADASTVFSAARGERDDDVAGLVGSGAGVVGTLADRRDELSETLAQARPLEDELLATAPLADPLLEDLAALSRDITPGLRDIAAELPALNAILARGDVLRRNTERSARGLVPAIETAGPIIRDLYPTVASIKPLLGPLDEIVTTVARYEEDITAAAEGLLSATGTFYPEGKTAPGSSVLRFMPQLVCHRARDPYPDPGETRTHSQAC